MIGTVSDATFEAEVLKVPGPVLVDFWAAWCGPCRQLTQVLEDMAIALEGRLTIVRLDVDANPQTAAKQGIQSVPTLIMFRDGQTLARKVGALPRQRLVQWAVTTVADGWST